MRYVERGKQQIHTQNFLLEGGGGELTLRLYIIYVYFKNCVIKIIIISIIVT